MKRADWHLRANLFVLLYLLAALVTGVVSALSSSRQLSWLTVHLLLLGAITNGILMWSEHFVAALLWSRSQGRLRNLPLLLILNLGILGVLLGESTHSNWVVVPSALLFGGVIFYYLWGIRESIAETLNRRYVGLIRYYQFAGIALLIGVILGSIDVFKSDDDPWQPKLSLAHLHVNLMGWVGLTIIGTLITLWPTILRTPMHARAVKLGEIGLQILLVGLLVVVLAALLSNLAFFAIGELVYLFGFLITLTPSALVLKQRIPDRASSWMVATGAAGYALLIALDAFLALSSTSAESFLESIEDHSLVIFVVWLLPIFLGSLTYLLPVVLGRGPKMNRELEAIVNFGWKWRVFLLPVSSVLLLFTDFQLAGFLVAGTALGSFLILAFVTMARAGASRKDSLSSSV